MSSSSKEKEWPVRVYRRRQQPPPPQQHGQDDGEPTGNSELEGHVEAYHRWNRIHARNATGQQVPVMATPRRGCILIPQVKARIYVSNSDSEEAKEKSKEQQSSCNDVGTVVQRRRNVILVRSGCGEGAGRGTGDGTNNSGGGDGTGAATVSTAAPAPAPPGRTIALVFRSEQECLDFSDRLLALNPPPKKKSDDGLVGSATSAAAGSDVAAAADHQHQREDDNDDGVVLSYVARLLNDPQFLGFVQGLESRLNSSEDGKLMLDALSSSPSST